MEVIWWAIYLTMGLLVGFFAGLLGIGGGMILVSLMVMMFGAQGFPPDRVVHLALGTSLVSIVFTSLASVRAHQFRGAVRWDIVKQVTLGLVIGALLGTLVAEQLASKYLAIFFVIFVYYSAFNMFRDAKPRATRQLPGPVGMQVAGGLVGVLSALVGAGGGVITIPLMTLCNVPMRQCVGTSAALGIPVAIAGTIGFIATGIGKDHLPPLSVGYVYLPALAGIVIGTFFTVPSGARAAHALPVTTLKQVFAAIMFIVATRMLWSLYAM